MRKVILIILILFYVQPSFAVSICNCSDDEGLAENYDRAYLVFTATVSKIINEYEYNRQRILFNVHKSWKRANNKKISAYNATTDFFSEIRAGVTCGYNFKKKESYLVFAYREKPMSGALYVSKCGGIKLLKDAKKEIKTLGQPIHIFEKRKRKLGKANIGKTPLPQITPLPDMIKENKDAMGR